MFVFPCEFVKGDEVLLMLHMWLFAPISTMYLCVILMRGMCELLLYAIYSVVYFSLPSFLMLDRLEKYASSYYEMILMVGG